MARRCWPGPAITTTTGAGNVIAYNAKNGVEVSASSNNGIRENSIFANKLLGIDLNNGANNNASAPVLTSAVSSATGSIIQGALTAAPCTTYTLEFFSTPPGETVQGRVYLGSIAVTTDAQGEVALIAILSTVVSVGEFITAMATDPMNNTSEFSGPIVVVG